MEAVIFAALAASARAADSPMSFPAGFHTQMVATNGTNLYVRVGGKGPAVVLLHGFGFRQFDPRAQSNALDRALAETSAACS